MEAIGIGHALEYLKHQLWKVSLDARKHSKLKERHLPAGKDSSMEREDDDMVAESEVCLACAW